MFTVFSRISSDEYSKNYGWGISASWDSKSNFIGFLTLMGCPQNKIQRFIEIGQVNFVVWDGELGKRHFYTTNRNLVQFESDADFIREQYSYLTHISLLPR